MTSHARVVVPVLPSPLGRGVLGAATPAPLEQADMGEEKWGRGGGVGVGGGDL